MIVLLISLLFVGSMIVYTFYEIYAFERKYPHFPSIFDIEEDDE